MEIDVQQLIDIFSKLPTIGKRSATRITLDLIKNNNLLPYAKIMESLAEKITSCEICHNIDVMSPCKICNDTKKSDNILCVVEEVEDLWAIEKGNVFNGKYHILGGTLSALKGKSPDDLHIDSLIKRIANSNIKEVIIATNATMDGQTTAFYIMDLLRDKDIKISKLAHGIPLGGELGYLDDGTLNAAFNARQPF